jgi:prepilin-type processing-associated H-X9-DG protein
MPRVRSISMNGYIGQEADEITTTGGCNTTDWGGAGAGYRAYEKESQTFNPGPAKLWLTLDEHADSINDAFFMFSMTRPGFDDGPAAYHDGACGFSFVDGHAEIHKWQQLQNRPRCAMDGSAHDSPPLTPVALKLRIDAAANILQFVPSSNEHDKSEKDG